MGSSLLLWLVTALLPLAPPTGNTSVDQADTLVVCAPALRTSLQPWLLYRQAQGHRIYVDSDYRTADDVRALVRRAAGYGRLRTVVLVGDVQHDPGRRDFHLPTQMVPAVINTAWGSEPTIASDNGYADLDDDAIPELSIGRMPAGSAAELTALVDKTISYERLHRPGLWRRRIQLVAGVGGFGAIADAVLETATRSLVRRGIPDGYRTQIAYASWRSPYCPDPRLFRDEVVRGFNQGCLCWVYIGHGHREGLDWVRVPIGVAPILQADDVPRIACQAGPPIAVFLSCYGAAFDAEQDGVAERMLAHAGGPIAVIGGSRVTMPYGMTVLSQALMSQMFRQPAQPLGDVLLEAKRATLAADSRPPTRLLDTLARAISPNPDDLEGERREHVQMFHLLGDPLLQVEQPQTVDVRVSPIARPGEPLKIHCRAPVTGACVVELVCGRGQLTFAAQPRTQFDGTHQGMAALTDIYRRANDDRYASRRLQATESEFETTLQVPDHANGTCLVRVFVQGARAFALGAATLRVQATPRDADQREPTSERKHDGDEN